MQSRTIHLMGTFITTSLDHPDGDQILAETKDRLYDYNQRFSANDETSLLMQINHSAGTRFIQVPEDLYTLIKIGKQASIDSHGALNIAIGPLIKQWHIGFKDAKVPSEEAIQEALSHIDPTKIELNDTERTVKLLDSGMEIDLGAIAKGYFADKILEFWEKRGVQRGLINLGGNVKVMGPSEHPDQLWRIGIQDPSKPRNTLLTSVMIQSGSVVTSGIYERSLTVNGQPYHHIFDGESGYPIHNDIASVTIIAPKSLTCEIWTTRLFASASATEALDRLNHLKMRGISGIIIDRDRKIYIADSLKG
ncbi:MAG: FAD:protein FMN transferase [Aerococcus sp.]|nr:FAD:protein FMN transferase [Aerococcus sp.]